MRNEIRHDSMGTVSTLQKRRKARGAKPHPTRKVGFTLVEVLVTLVIGVLIVLITLTTYRTVAGMRQKIMGSSTRESEIRYLVNRFRDDAANIFRGKSSQRTLITGVKAVTEAGRADQLRFYAVFDPPRSASYPAGDLYLIEYSIQNIAGQPPVLMRRSTAVFSGASSETAVTTIPMAGEIKTVQFDYQYQGQWYDQWSRADAAPSLIRMTLGIAETGANGPELRSQSYLASLEPMTQIRSMSVDNTKGAVQPANETNKP